jgi:hypothetical protein
VPGSGSTFLGSFFDDAGGLSRIVLRFSRPLARAPCSSASQPVCGLCLLGRVVSPCERGQIKVLSHREIPLSPTTALAPLHLQPSTPRRLRRAPLAREARDLNDYLCEPGCHCRSRLSTALQATALRHVFALRIGNNPSAHEAQSFGVWQPSSPALHWTGPHAHGAPEAYQSHWKARRALTRCAIRRRRRGEDQDCNRRQIDPKL